MSISDRLREALAVPQHCQPCRLCVFTDAENARVTAAYRAAHADTIETRRAARARAPLAGTFWSYRNDQKEADFAASVAAEAETAAIIRERLGIDA